MSVYQTRSQRVKNMQQEVLCAESGSGPDTSHTLRQGTERTPHARTHAHTPSLTYGFPACRLGAGPAGLTVRREAAQASIAAGGARGNRLKEEGGAARSSGGRSAFPRDP